MDNELDDQVDETTEVAKEEEEQAVETQQPSYADVLKKFKLDTRWKADDPVKLVEDMAQSYVNAETSMRQREQENAEMRRLLYEKMREPQVQPQVRDDDVPDDVKQARKFVREEAEQLLQPLKQQNEILETRLHIMTRMNNPKDPMFAEAVNSGELEAAMMQMGLPPNVQNINHAYNAIVAYKTQQSQAQAIQQAKQAGAESERDKAAAFVETGGKPKRQLTLPSEAEIRRAAQNMSESEFDAYLTKYGVKLPNV